jgi:hypothetical protein
MSKKLSQYFLGIGAKRLSEVEIVPKKSNQHEFNGTKKFKRLFGTEKIIFSGKFLYLGEEDDNIIEGKGNLTWYDSRLDHPTRSEHRLYYTSNDVIRKAQPGDILIIGRTSQTELLVLIARAGSTSEQQLLWLFGLNEVQNKLIIKDFTEKNIELGFAAKQIISSLGFEIEEPVSVDFLELILKKFGGVFPSTIEFSNFARKTLDKTPSSIDSPDEALLIWLEREEMLFKTLERHLVQQKLHKGFGKKGTDVDDFISFSLSVQNRRKSRAGLSFENHLAQIFIENDLLFTKKGKTERNNEPDFLFPGINEYRNLKFDNSRLTMLGLKTTAKDRWRQVIPEADKIWPKHLITLEPSISKNQTDEMIAQQVQLVLPVAIIQTYTTEQRKNIMTLADFIKLIVSRQKKSIRTKLF